MKAVALTLIFVALAGAQVSFDRLRNAPTEPRHRLPYSGRKKWETAVVDHTHGYALTHAALVVKDKIIVGPAGGELGIAGFIAAYDAKTGKQVWKFNTVPQPGEPGNETWGKDSWKHGGAPV